MIHAGNFVALATGVLTLTSSRTLLRHRHFPTCSPQKIAGDEEHDRSSVPVDNTQKALLPEISSIARSGNSQTVDVNDTHSGADDERPPRST